MTDTETKLADAKIQLSLAEQNVDHYEVMRSCINAFISNARSVTFTMQKETSSNEKSKTWYAQKQTEMKSNPMLRFFQEQRRISIHERSVELNTRNVKILRVEVAGKVVGAGGIATAFEFDDYGTFVQGDNGNVFRVCKAYLAFLEQLVQEWLHLHK